MPATPPLVPKSYTPQETEDFMNPIMLEYFRQKLLQWKGELVAGSSETILQMMDDGGIQEPDMTDRATAETDKALELRRRDRERRLISKIEEALDRIREGEYGYCEETGEPISIKRLEARPTATLCLEAQERHERLERTQRDDRVD